jgi:hypothetical protein
MLRDTIPITEFNDIDVSSRLILVEANPLLAKSVSPT